MIRSHTHTPPAEGEALEIAPGVLWMQMPLPFRPDTVNVYALRDSPADGGGWTIVDTGLDTRRGRDLWQALLAGPLAGAPVTRLIATHHHIDHIGLAGWFQDRGAELWTSRTAWLMARMAPSAPEPADSGKMMRRVRSPRLWARTRPKGASAAAPRAAAPKHRARRRTGDASAEDASLSPAPGCPEPVGWKVGVVMVLSPLLL